jgi:hypothetical protein
MKKNERSRLLPLTHALAWIVGSTLLVSGSSNLAIKAYLRHRHETRPVFIAYLDSIVQTGPQREALKTEYLAELLGLSMNHPICADAYDLKRAKEQLLRSPLISRAEVKLIKPSTLYIDYTVRQPIAFLADYENVAIDKEGYLFPFTPFFSPKNLPEIYIGLSPFSLPTSELDKPLATWNAPLQGKYMELAFHLLSIISDPAVRDIFNVKQIDISKAFAESYGVREIVIRAEDEILMNSGARQVRFVMPRFLRLSTKQYAQELGNFLKLRQQLLQEERKELIVPSEGSGVIIRPYKIIDFRISRLAFIETEERDNR